MVDTIILPNERGSLEWKFLSCIVFPQRFVSIDSRLRLLRRVSVYELKSAIKVYVCLEIEKKLRGWNTNNRIWNKRVGQVPMGTGRFSGTKLLY